jgi:hypothetical protein
MFYKSMVFKIIITWLARIEGGGPFFEIYGGEGKHNYHGETKFMMADTFPSIMVNLPFILFL